MRYTTIPGIGTKVSTVCFGTGNVDFEHKEENEVMLDLFFSQGGNFFDTANIYGKWLESASNESEIILGKWMEKKIKEEKSFRREDIIISTKGGHPNLDTMSLPRITQKELREDLEESLSSMRTDYIDIYWLHRDAPSIPVDVILEPLLNLKHEGKINLFGLSNWTTSRICEAELFLKKSHEDGFFGIQNRWSYAAMNPDGTEDPTLVPMTQEEYEWHMDTKIASMPYSGMAKGYFTKLQKSSKDKMNHKLLDYYDNELNDDRMIALDKISKDIERPVSQLALAFLFNQPFPVFPIIRFAKPDQLFDTVEATSLKLSDKQMNILRRGRQF